MELRSVGLHEADLIEKLFQETYNREQGIEYWKWCFQNPHGYINAGMFEKNRLIGYYAAQFTKKSACMYSAMVHPKHRRKGIYLKLAFDLCERISTNRSFVYLFSNEMIRPIHLEKEGFIEVYQVEEYRVPIKNISVKCPIPMGSIHEYDEYMIWRYRNHPLIKYNFQFEGIYSFYKDRVQIVDYKTLQDTDESNLFEAIEMGKYLGYWNDKKYVSFWSEIKLDYPFAYLPVWKQYKIFNKDISIEDILSIDKTRMGMNDNF